MPFKLRTVDDLAETMGSHAAASKLLKEAGATVVHGMFDQGALDALDVEPKATNIGKASKNIWTIAKTDGVGAVKFVLDQLDLDIVRHLQHRANYFTLRNAKGQRAQIKMYSASTVHKRTGNASFTVTGYLREASVNYYMLMCYEDQVAWAISRAGLASLHRTAVKSGGKSGAMTISYEDLDNLNGRARLSLKSDSDLILSSAKQLGL